MANIYHLDGNYAVEGLQGSGKCDEAWQTACYVARDGGVAVILDDDDGIWIVDPDGRRRETTAEEWPDEA